MNANIVQVDVRVRVAVDIVADTLWSRLRFWIQQHLQLKPPYYLQPIVVYATGADVEEFREALRAVLINAQALKDAP